MISRILSWLFPPKADYVGLGHLNEHWVRQSLRGE
jgi:hypothetical protein